MHRPFYCVLFLQCMILSVASEALNATSVNATNITIADSAASDDAPISFRNITFFVVGAGVLCLSLWCFFLTCTKRTKRTASSDNTQPMDVFDMTVSSRPTMTPIQNVYYGSEDSLRYGGNSFRGMPM